MPPDTLPAPLGDRTEPFRDDLCRSATFELLRAEADASGDGLTISGYGAVFNTVTEISSWEGDFEEVIAPGAFRKSLREGTPKMQFDHGQHPLLGSLPLGVWTTAQEDDRGLYVEGRLTDNWLIQPFREAIRDGGVEGMSFRFSVVRDDWVDKDGKKIQPGDLWELLWDPGDRGPIRRTLKEVRCSEVGPVVWPAYPETSVGVRSKVVIDLAHLGSAAARETLARAVFAADAAARTQTPDVVPTSGTEPRATAGPAADEHPAQAAPLATVASAAGEHSSRPRRRADRAAVLARVRAAMNTMRS